MIKIMLGIIALAIVFLGYFLYTEQPVKSDNKITGRDIPTHEVSTQEEVVSGKKIKATSTTKMKKQKNLPETKSYTKPKLDESTIRKIKSEVNGTAPLKLDTDTIRKIESEVSGNTALKLDEKTIRKIESEVDGNTAPQLDEKTIHIIESEINENAAPKLHEKTIRIIESEVNTSL